MSNKSNAIAKKTDVLPILFFLIVQIAFWCGISYQKDGEDVVLWKGTRNIKPELGIVPPLPSDFAVNVLSFGDKEFYFRLLAFELQNAGDSFGRSTPLKDYDYPKLYKWWKLLDTINIVSNQVPSLVSYYYAASQEPKRDVPYVVKYLEEYGDHDPAKNWWWYTQAVYHAKHRVKDNEMALKVAKKLSVIPKEVDMPYWARQMSAFILEDMGEYEQALVIIKDIMDNYDHLPTAEKNFMNYFINERLSTINRELGSEEGMSDKK